MIALRKPSRELILAHLAAQSVKGFSYQEVGRTANDPPSTYVVDRTRARLGTGEAVFRKATEALKAWEQFRLGWVETCPAGAPIVEGQPVAILARCFGLWWINACKIVYVVDESGPVCRFGFAYGTLPDHAGQGEERFLVDWDRETGEVHYDILAFSRPQWLLSKLGYPSMRRLQKRFGRESSNAMARSVEVDKAAIPGGSRT